MNHSRPEPLDCVVQNYAWGTTDFIAKLQGRDVTGSPEAELWMGAHDRGPSRIANGTSLAELIADDPVAALGAETAEAFTSLPFLAKVLSAGAPLSIQTHPSSTQAMAGFERENQAGIAIDAQNRSYRDDRHKPELVVALTAFEGKCGFRSIDASRALFSELGIGEVADRLDGNDVGELMAWLLGDERPARLVDDVVGAARLALEHDAAHPFAIELAWTARLATAYPGDPGTIVALLLNHVRLEPGEGLFLDAGQLHAYLGGSAIEVMANSDNVVRGGLTQKHIDVAELGRILDPVPLEPKIERPTGDVHTYRSPVREFAVTRVASDSIERRVSVAGGAPSIVIVTEGAFSLETTAGERAELDVGSPCWIPASAGDWSVTGAGLLFRATVGQL